MTTGGNWLAEVGRKTRPVPVLTRPEVIDVRELVTVAEIIIQVRGLAAEVDFDSLVAGLDRLSVINCAGLHTVAQSASTRRVGGVGEATMRSVCLAVSYTLGC